MFWVSILCSSEGLSSCDSYGRERNYNYLCPDSYSEPNYDDRCQRQDGYRPDHYYVGSNQVGYSWLIPKAEPEQRADQVPEYEADKNLGRRYSSIYDQRTVSGFGYKV